MGSNQEAAISPPCQKYFSSPFSVRLLFSFSFSVIHCLFCFRFSLGYTQNVQLIEDLRFTTATTKIKATPDGEFIIASGELVVINSALLLDFV